MSKFGEPYVAPPGVVDERADMTTPPVDQLKAMTGAQFLTRLAALMKANLPRAADAPMLARLATIGVTPGRAERPP